MRYKVPTSEKCFGLRAALLDRYVSALYDAVLGDARISSASLYVLMLLHETPDATAGELRYTLHTDFSTIGYLLRGLIKRNLVAAGPRQRKGRKTYRLNEKGEGMLVRCHGEWQRAQERVREVLGPELLNRLTEAVERIRAIDPRPERARVRPINYYDFRDEALDG